MFLNLKSRHIIEGATAQIEKKQDKRACESVCSEKLNIKRQPKRTKCVLSTTINLKFVTA